CGQVPQDLGEPSSGLVIVAWLSVRFTPLGNGPDDVHYLIREWKIVCCTGLFSDCDKIVECTPIWNAYVSVFGYWLRSWIALGSKQARVPQWLEEPQEVGPFENEGEPMPREFLAFLHLVDERPLIGRKDRHRRRFS